MQLRDYAKQPDIKVGEIARSLGISRQHMYRLINGKRKIPAEMVLPLERATHGRVTRHELRPDLYPPTE